MMFMLVSMTMFTGQSALRTTCASAGTAHAFLHDHIDGTKCFEDDMCICWESLGSCSARQPSNQTVGAS